jgi:adenosylmethionine-8-amino-7-oxononanoate aminotransferase
VRLAERLLNILPGNPAKIFYSDNGSTAVEVALKMALQFWSNKGKPEKNKIMAFEHAYHGDTFGAMSVSGRGIFTDAFRDLLFETIVIETPNETNLSQIKHIIQSHEGKIAAFIYEPLLQAAGGMRMYGTDEMNHLLSFIQQKEILCIADEVLTGFGRTGPLFASEKLKPKPHLICLSKGLTGGTMALGVTACTREIFEAFLSEDRTRTFYHGHSFTANPLACTAALASLDILEEKKCRDQINSICLQHKAFVLQLSKNNQDRFRNIRMMGTILAFEISTGNDEYVNPVGTTIMRKALAQGIYLRPLGNTVYVMPPYCITEEQLKKIYRFLTSLQPEV